MSDPLLKPFKKEQLLIVFHPGSWRQTLPGTGDESAEVQYEDWRKGKVLGSGMYGTVRLIRSVQDEKKVRAVKEVFKKKTKTIRVIQELQALVTLKKYPEYFVQFFGWWEDEDYFYFAMEYVEDGDLVSLLGEETKLRETDAQTIAKQILKGLETMHEHKICHRGVKPDNILAISWLPGPLRVKLADFGCSKHAVGTDLRSTIGTFGYMAPEVSGYIEDQETLHSYRIPLLPPVSIDSFLVGSAHPQSATKRRGGLYDDEFVHSPEEGLGITLRNAPQALQASSNPPPTRKSDDSGDTRWGISQATAAIKAAGAGQVGGFEPLGGHDSPHAQHPQTSSYQPPTEESNETGDTRWGLSQATAAIMGVGAGQEPVRLRNSPQPRRKSLYLLPTGKSDENGNRGTRIPRFTAREYLDVTDHALPSELQPLYELPPIGKSEKIGGPRGWISRAIAVIKGAGV
ncbi:uncharacterized protein H6S33_008171 [Morchella sextelata]|uniref:uncharacterized protein n=1 Tax=Morchella sextelata TaxID=1174677 RepID=UPI001D047766|nr:uncharacterized protein H6S33_008171 [Morchella sextelata]KAH0603167.1 hypothetical protein H6S33_008171 [Morchella sextelata]